MTTSSALSFPHRACRVCTALWIHIRLNPYTPCRLRSTERAREHRRCQLPVGALELAASLLLVPQSATGNGWEKAAGDAIDRCFGVGAGIPVARRSAGRGRRSGKLCERANGRRY